MNGKDRKPLPQNGIWRVMPSPVVSEMLAQCGLDFQILDCEHGGYDYASLLADMFACQANACLPLVRVSGTDKVEVQRCLDLGAKGIVFPQLNDLEDFQRAASWMDYAPKGTRGFNPFVRAGGYGLGTGAVENAARSLFIPIIETLSAVEQLDAILQTPRIDMVYLGTYDLSAQLNCPGEMAHPRMVAVIDQILTSCAEHGVEPAMMALNADVLKNLRGRGVRTLVHGVETHRMKEKFATFIPGEKST